MTDNRCYIQLERSGLEDLCPYCVLFLDTCVSKAYLYSYKCHIFIYLHIILFESLWFTHTAINSHTYGYIHLLARMIGSMLSVYYLAPRPQHTAHASSSSGYGDSTLRVSFLCDRPFVVVCLLVSIAYVFMLSALVGLVTRLFGCLNYTGTIHIPHTFIHPRACSIHILAVNYGQYMSLYANYPVSSAVFGECLT